MADKKEKSSAQATGSTEMGRSQEDEILAQNPKPQIAYRSYPKSTDCFLAHHLRHQKLQITRSEFLTS
ncbi:unnamed protein product [Lactuca virosa]|uniref:Uncharacterized protein n=1 Tax=Lactuca virosa TaxID=75947 RepID=A0AAU9N0R6_9ASTR|nr:unnamed protein product [Lactuca virosa]